MVERVFSVKQFFFASCPNASVDNFMRYGCAKSISLVEDSWGGK